MTLTGDFLAVDRQDFLADVRPLLKYHWEDEAGRPELELDDNYVELDMKDYEAIPVDARDVLRLKDPEGVSRAFEFRFKVVSVSRGHWSRGTLLVKFEVELEDAE